MDLGRLMQIVQYLSYRVVYSVDDVVALFERQTNGVTLFNYMQSVAARLVELRRYRTAETYRTTLNSFMRLVGEDLRSQISSDMMMDYEVPVEGIATTQYRSI